MIFNMVGGGNTNATLNFSVIAYASKELIPETTKENVIAVVTDTEITSYIFDYKEPENPVEGMVWIVISEENPLGFNALKRNAIQLYPSYVKQYVNGSWITRETKINQENVWFELFDGILFDSGNQYTNITGGWTGDASIGDVISGEAWTQTTFGSCARTVNKINLSLFDTLNVNFTSMKGNATIAVDESPSIDKAIDLVAYKTITAKTGISSLDVSGLTDEYYVYVISGTHGGTNCSFNANKVWLE